ncbi:hypothetical protein IEO21_01349 [Rhodonia placenta]|uniref:Inositol phospholipid synthesis and fat-storage-inducing TM-domain-containing protein n=1 Tax=Rhodonia placenta TaxID=104341 RepID=A0A8H7U5A7_9APHY|nr:hypothetical protein IEO21_01349 [Postia placenta]
MADVRIAVLVVITSIVLFGTLYSVVNSTYLDTSNPLLTYLPHPLHSTHYFASKGNILNVYFIKRVWAWTSAAFLAHYLTSPPAARTKERVLQFLAATAVWLTFTGWFFGPAVLDRLVAYTGGECVLGLPSGDVVSVPADYCYTKSTLSAATHPALFPAALLLPEDGWRGRPRLRRGHDVSGHVFLLTMSTLLLADQLRASFGRAVGRWSAPHWWAMAFGVGVVVLELLAVYTTSVYFHTPFEKLTGYLLGVAGFAITQLPVFQPAPEAVVVSKREVPREAGEKAEIAKRQ